MKGFFLKLFYDQAGEVDEKRVIGMPVFLLGILFALVAGSIALVKGKADYIGPILLIAGFITGSGLSALGVAVLGDQGKLGAIPKSD